MPPGKIARLGDGHNILLGDLEYTFEHLFDRPDRSFPEVVAWLQDFIDHSPTELALPSSTLGKNANQLAECLISLVVRSPRFRHTAERLVETVRGFLPEKGQMRPVTGANMELAYRNLLERLGQKGSKVAIVHSENCEFIYGDGCYTNIAVGYQPYGSISERMLVSITPMIAVLFVCPPAYRREPSVVIWPADQEMVLWINEITQLYSGNWLFYRSERPKLTEHFRCGEFLRFSECDPVDGLVNRMPGVATLDPFDRTRLV